MKELIDWIINNKNLSMPVILNSIISIGIAFIGWIVIFLLNLRQQKISLKNNAKMKIYEELSLLVKNFNDKSIKLGVSLKPDFTFMEMGFIDKNKERVQRNYEGIKIWNEYTKQLAKKISDFNSSQLEIWNYITYWISAVPQLKKMNKDLFWLRFGKLTKELWNFHDFLNDLSINEFYWEKWNRKEVDDRAKKIEDKLNEILGYFDDFVTDIHNILVGKIFGHYKKKRENFLNLPESYKILTPKGIKIVKNKIIKIIRMKIYLKYLTKLFKRTN